MSTRRTRLFNYLKICFFANLLLFVSVFCFWLWVRSWRDNTIELVKKQFAQNMLLYSQLDYANNILTNKFFNYAAVFASNVVSVASSFSASPSLSPSSPTVSPEVSPVSFPPELPPVSFRHYFEADGVPYIRVRNTSFRQGDLLLGYPIQAISPDVVQYRDKFFKVEEDSSK